MSFFSRSGVDCHLFASESADPPLTTPFEDWCEREGVHPEAPGAWEFFERTVLETPPPAPSAGLGAA